jgi:hypothetical protein
MGEIIVLHDDVHGSHYETTNIAFPNGGGFAFTKFLYIDLGGVIEGKHDTFY